MVAAVFRVRDAGDGAVACAWGQRAATDTLAWHGELWGAAWRCGDVCGARDAFDVAGDGERGRLGGGGGAGVGERAARVGGGPGASGGVVDVRSWGGGGRS